MVNGINKTPLFITFEGGEGAGKSTQIKSFLPWFKQMYGPAMATREPGGEPVAEKIRKIILNKKNIIHPYTELSLFNAARVQVMNEIVKPKLDEGVSVILDRFYDSTVAYQGYGRGISVHEIGFFNSIVVGGYFPNLTFVIDVPPEIGLTNAKERGELSRIDSERLEFHRRVNKGFIEIAEQNLERCVLIQYEEGISNVQDKIRKEFSRRYFS